MGILNNYNLCHIKTIKWEEIITGPRSKYVYVYNFTEPERDCTPCHESCKDGCWGEGAHNCQKFSKINCAAQCHSGRCFGPRPRECCHLFCAGGCTGPKQSDCLVRRKQIHSHFLLHLLLLLPILLPIDFFCPLAEGADIQVHFLPSSQRCSCGLQIKLPPQLMPTSSPTLFLSTVIGSTLLIGHLDDSILDLSYV